MSDPAAPVQDRPLTAAERYGELVRDVHAAKDRSGVCSTERHAEIKADAELFALLPYIGEQDDGVEVMELRNCPCNSTLAVVLRASKGG